MTTRQVTISRFAVYGLAVVRDDELPRPGRSRANPMFEIKEATPCGDAVGDECHCNATSQDSFRWYPGLSIFPPLPRPIPRRSQVAPWL